MAWCRAVAIAVTLQVWGDAGEVSTTDAQTRLSIPDGNAAAAAPTVLHRRALTIYRASGVSAIPAYTSCIGLLFWRWRPGWFHCHAHSHPPTPPPPLACIADSCAGGCGLVLSTGGTGRGALGVSLLPGAVDRSSPYWGCPVTGAVPLRWRGSGGIRRGLGAGPLVGVPRRDGVLGHFPAAPALQCVPAPRGHHPPARRCRSGPPWLWQSWVRLYGLRGGPRPAVCVAPRAVW